MRKPTPDSALTWTRRTLGTLLYVACALTWWACGSSSPVPFASDEGRSSPTANTCNHPSPGCPCSTTGEVVSCGSVEQTYGSYVACSLGTSTCDGQSWGPCVGDQIATRSIQGGGLTLASLGTSGPCANNPCDPYCNSVVDTPGGFDAGGLLLTDGGYTINGGDGGGGGGSTGGTTFYNDPTGQNACSPNRNISSSSTDCTYDGASEYTTCQQDFHCDSSSHKCVFSNGVGFVDMRCTGIDLTVESPCTSGSGAYFPICNRGLATVPAGSKIAVNYTNPPSPPTTCSLIAGTPDCVVTVPGSGLGPGQCMDATTCGPPGDKFVVINDSATVPVITECSNGAGANACGNNATYAKTAGGCNACVGTCVTTVTGKVYDPAENEVLPGVTVFHPTGALTALPSGVACDSCASLSSPADTTTFSAVDGSFELPVPAGINVPVVFQSGRWRREIIVPLVTACKANAIPNAGATQTRLPANHLEGNIPFTAIVTGQHEAAECLLAKIGVATTEFAKAPSPPSYTSSTPIHLFKSTGADVTGGGAPTPDSDLWDVAAHMNAYSTLLLPCAGSSGWSLNSAEQTVFDNWLNAGGRAFLDHKSAYSTLMPAPPSPSPTIGGAAPFNATSTWINDGDATASFNGKIIGSDAVHTQFQTWLTNAGAYGSGYVNTPDGLIEATGAVTAAPTSATQWVRGAASNDWASHPNGTFELAYSFDTPVGAAKQCGRVSFQGMHVDVNRGNAGGALASCSGAGCQFPGECSLGTALTPNELTFEYLLFNLTSCGIGGGVVPPPPPPPLQPTTFTRDYQSTCAADQCVAWQLFSWQATIPTGTSIAFSAQTALASGNTPGTYGAAVPIGTANATTTTWTSDACTVDQHLQNLRSPWCPGVNPPQHSEPWLRVTFTLNPSATAAPVLQTWRQTYDCVPCN